MGRPNGGSGGEFSGIDPDRLGSMIRSLESGSETLEGAKNRYRGRFERYGVPTGALDELGRIGSWANDQVPMLKRRHNMAVALQQRMPSLETVHVREPVMSSAEAKERGEELADRINGLDEVDEEGGNEILDVARILQNYSDDPEVLAAFYAKLDPQRLDTMANYLVEAEVDPERARIYHEAFSETLGIALSMEHPPPELERVREHFLQEPETPGDAWARGWWLQHGDFPPNWLADAARANVLDDFADDPDGQDWRGGNVFATRMFGLPEDNVALYLKALGNNGTATRIALRDMGGSDRSVGDSIEQILGYTHVVGTGDEVADALGEAIEAGAGVGEEEPGEHSTLTSRFAFEAFTTIAQHGEDVSYDMKDSLANLAASYSHEMTMGAYFGDAGDRDSSLSRPENLDDIVGVDPSFFLSPEDTYNFLKQFAHHDQFTDVFDEEMGRLQEEALREAAETGDRAFMDTSRALGALGGLEYQAQVEVRGDLDALDAKVREYMQTALTLGFNKAAEGFTPQGRVAGWGWKAFKYAAGKGIKELTGPPDLTRVDQVEASNDHVVLAQRYQMASYLYDAGWETEPPPPDNLVDGDSLKSLDQLHEEDLLDDFYDWMDSTGDGDPNSTSLDSVADRAADARNGAAATAERLARAWEDE